MTTTVGARFGLGLGLGRQVRALRRVAAPRAKTLLLRAGAFRAVRHLRPSRQVAILRYHAICGPQGLNGFAYASPGICVTPAAFERHVAYLSASYEVISLPEAVEALRRGTALPANAVALTFDDGYADNLEAARTLSRYGLPATFYVTAGCLSGEQPFWPSEIRGLVAAIPGPILTLHLGGSRRILMPLGGEADRQAALAAITRLFKSNPIPVRERLREQLRSLTGHVPIPSPMLTWEQLGEMHRLGMTIAAHTMTHPNLPSAGLADARTEILESKRRLERELATEVSMFSYPNGGAERYYTPELQRIVCEAGFAAAATSRNGFAGRGSDLYGLERVQVAERLEDLVFALEVERFLFKPAGGDGASRGESERVR